ATDRDVQHHAGKARVAEYDVAAPTQHEHRQPVLAGVCQRGAHLGLAGALHEIAGGPAQLQRGVGSEAHVFAQIHGSLALWRWRDGPRSRSPLHGIYGQPTFSRMTTRGQPVGARAPETTDSFRLLVEGVRDYAIFMHDCSGLVLTWNAGAQRLKGYRAEEIIGKHFSCFYPSDAVEAGKPARLLALAAREGRVEDEGW